MCCTWCMVSKHLLENLSSQITQTYWYWVLFSLGLYFERQSLEFNDWFSKETRDTSLAFHSILMVVFNWLAWGIFGTLVFVLTGMSWTVLQANVSDFTSATLSSLLSGASLLILLTEIVFSGLEGLESGKNFKLFAATLVFV